MWHLINCPNRNLLLDNKKKIIETNKQTIAKIHVRILHTNTKFTVAK